jgi:hypothetical protein
MKFYAEDPLACWSTKTTFRMQSCIYTNPYVDSFDLSDLY